MASSTAVTAEDSSNNSAAEGDDGNQDDSNSLVQIKRRKLFRIDTSKIESVPHCQQNAELQDLDLHVYDQETFEQGHLNVATLLLCWSVFLSAGLLKITFLPSYSSMR